jgi:alkaline phosphatase
MGDVTGSKVPGRFLVRKFFDRFQIDHAHHETWAQRALIETMEFDKAIDAADRLTSDEDTLVVVTADHAHVMSIAGYPVRGNPLLGLSDTADDGLPYATLSYANGPGARSHVYDETTKSCVRADLTNDNFNSLDYRQDSTAILSIYT